MAALDSVIGSGNRLLFMRDGRPEPVIVGRDKGIEHNGAWYSNLYAWTNTYYDPMAWRPGWQDWDSDPYSSAPVIQLDDAEPRTAREKNAVDALDRWLSNYRYADVDEVVEYFVDWYGRTDSERSRLRRILNESAVNRWECNAAAVADYEARNGQ